MTDEMKEKIEQNRERLVTAFGDQNFQDKLRVIRSEIEEELQKFLEFLRDELHPEQRFFDNVESRIKSPKSFLEKIYRKDYVICWEPTDDMAYNQELIAQKLPDLIGFRINCFFCKDEEIIFNKLQDFCCNLPAFDLKRTKIERQKNGHSICKVSGKYKDQYSFEIQVKAIMHNIWGEVEHKTIYKDRAYDPNTEDKRGITEEVFNILQASDRQLVTLFSRKNDKQRLVNALFYEITCAKVSAEAKTEILGNHYNSFFQIFGDSITAAAIQRMVGQDLIGETYQPQYINIDITDQRVRELKRRIEEQFLHFDLLCQYYIFSQIFGIDNFKAFLFYLASYQLRSIDWDFESQDDDAFGDEDDESSDGEAGGSNDEQEQMYASILAALGNHIRCRENMGDNTESSGQGLPGVAQQSERDYLESQRV